MFFQTGGVAESIYARVRDGIKEHELPGRAFIEELWASAAPFLDPDLAARAPSNGLVPSFWELYLAHVLKQQGIRVVPRNERSPRRKGPDLFAQSPSVWIEAVAATPGIGPHALQWGEGKVPDTKILLRLGTAVSAKVVQLKKHGDAGFVRQDQATVIAVSGAMLPYRFSEERVPRVVRTVLGIGHLVLTYSRTTGDLTDRGLEYCDQVTKDGQRAVRTDIFLTDECAHVSGLLYSASCWVHHPASPGTEFVLVHNPHARIPLPRGWLPVGTEYWVEHDDLCCVAHS